MINTDGTPTIANGAGDESRRETCPECGQPDNCGDCTHEPDGGDWRYDQSTRRTVVVTARVRIVNTLLRPEEWREIVETALRDDILTIAPDSIDVTVTNIIPPTGVRQ